MKHVPSQAMKTPPLSQSLGHSFHHHGLPWTFPYLSGIPGYPLLRYPAVHAYALSLLPEHFPWRPPLEQVDPAQASMPMFAGIYPERRLDNSQGKITGDESSMSLKLKSDIDQHDGAVKDMRPKSQETVFLTASTSAADRKKKRETDQAKYVCTACSKSYSTFSGLSKHKQFHCNQDIKKEFSCKYCDKTYVSLGALKMHIRTHTLPCKCKICGKAFSRPWLLQGHVRTHTGEKPFTCVHCLRAFADRSNLRAHLQTHSDVKKYSCKTCSKTFSRMSLLLKHGDSCSRASLT